MDFALVQNQFNTGSDITPSWATAIQQPGGSGGANEIRFCASGAGGLVTALSWPTYNRPGSVQAVPEAWCILTDTGTNASVTGNKIATYGPPSGGVVPYSIVARWAWSQDGTFASAPKFSAFADTSHTQPSAGTQPPGANNDAVTNGYSTDTSSTSYLKANAYGYGVDGSGNQQPAILSSLAGTLTTPVTATDGTAGGVSPGSNAWIATHWQSLQGFQVTSPQGQWIVDGTTPAWTTHTGTPVITWFWYWVPMLFTGPNMTVNAALTFLFNFQYTYT